MSETAPIIVEGVAKRFCRDLRKSLWYGLQDLAREVTGRERPAHLRPGEFWALEEISFTVAPGEILGIIGHNGAGKTTLLRILNGLLKPDRGEVRLRGRVGALISLGAGFNPILSGRENVFINGAVLGIPRREIARRFDEIVAFAELEEFIDAPVRSYSSGMKVRLGFAIATNIEPEILLIDEVLAVGDRAFKRKAQGRIREVLKRGVSVLFISHNLTQVSRLCHRVLCLNHGRIVDIGEPARVIAGYCRQAETQATVHAEVGEAEVAAHAEVSADERLRVRGVHLLDAGGEKTDAFHAGEDAAIRLRFHNPRPLGGLRFMWEITAEDGTAVSRTISPSHDRAETGDAAAICRFRRFPLVSGLYALTLHVFDATGQIGYYPYVMDLPVTCRRDDVGALQSTHLVDLDHEWTLRRSEEPPCPS